MSGRNIPHRYFTIRVVIVTCAVLAVGWLVFRSGILPLGQPRVLESAIPESTLPLKPARTAPKGFIEYRNERYRFSLFYPANLTFKERDEGSGAMTITFQDVETVQGFQIFIVPYGGQKVSEQRFKQDEPSGVRTQSRNITIDGIAATSFFGNNSTLGDTAEIWFIHNYRLYEVTTLKPLAGWLTPIMTSWEFI